MTREKDLVYICLTPVRDEAWVLPLFLEMNGAWADHIIILDQCSEDDTPKIAQSDPKVTYIRNDDATYDELYRQKVLYEAARKIPAKKRIIFFLDADEYIPPSLIGGDEWNQIQTLPKGTRVYLDWIQVLPNKVEYFKLDKLRAFGFIDDGSEIEGERIHNDRVPLGNNPPYYCKDLVNIHLGYVPENRNYKKNSWYIIWEFLNSGAHPIDLNINYHKFIGSTDTLNKIYPINDLWLSPEVLSDQLDIEKNSVTWWDRAIVSWFHEFGVEKFRKLDIWEANWDRLSMEIMGRSIENPQSGLDKKIISYLKSVKYKKNVLWVRVVNKFLRSLWN